MGRKNVSGQGVIVSFRQGLCKNAGGFHAFKAIFILRTEGGRSLGGKTIKPIACRTLVPAGYLLSVFAVQFRAIAFLT